MLRSSLRACRQSAARVIARSRTLGMRRGVILLYHRVAEPSADPWRIAVSPANFADHMAVLRRFGIARSMASFSRHLDEPGRADRSVAVTFDDGYADNLHNVLPILEAEAVPATLYVVADAIGDASAFWWDRLAEIFLASGRLPETPPPIPPAPGQADRWLAEDAHISGIALARHLSWSADEEAPATTRQRHFLAAWSHLVALDRAEQRAAVAALCAWAGVPTEPSDPAARPMTETELARFAASPLIEIGGHTSTHGDLSAVSESAAMDEIRGGRERLVAMTGQDVSSFAYPFGRMAAFLPDQLREAGFSNAVCSRFGVATQQSDRFRLPRLHVHNWSGAEFERTLAAVLGR